ncbi:MAG: hypothetical protein NT105_05355 [Verrucomicrobia bacterium]|nr:hypothetical protein [Verrucomicrobiota bacterium]
MIAYFLQPVLPGADPAWSVGWWGWWDQGWYWRSAQDLAHFRLKPDNYYYPLGYPAMGALFFRLMPSHAFLVPDLLCVVGILVLFHRICREFVSPWEAVALAAAAILLPRSILTDSLVVPWNSIPTHLINYAIIVLLVFCRPGWSRYFAASLLLALIPWFRAADAIYMIPVFAVELWRDLRQREVRQCIAKAMLTAGLFAISIGAIVAINYAVFGQAITPYVQTISMRRGMSFDGVLRKAYSIFLSANTMWNNREPMLIHRFPWLLFVLPGVVYLLKTERLRHAGWIGAMGCCVGFYLGYTGFEAANLFKYLVVRYWTWWIPLAALLAYLGAVKAWRSLTIRGVAAVTLPCLLIAGFVKQTENRAVPLETVTREDPSGSAVGEGCTAAVPKRIRLVLKEHRSLPVSKIVIPGLLLPLESVESYDTFAISQGDRMLKSSLDYTRAASDMGMVIVLRRDLAGDDPITVEFDRPKDHTGAQQFHLEPRYLQFSVGVGDLLWLWWKRWLDPLSLPAGRYWIR